VRKALLVESKNTSDGSSFHSMTGIPLPTLSYAGRSFSPSGDYVYQVIQPSGLPYEVSSALKLRLIRGVMDINSGGVTRIGDDFF
jgi:hypothetical protein